MMDSLSQNSSLQRLQNVEKRIVKVLELAGGVMDELAKPSGPRKELINNQCSEFMQLIKLDDEVTSIWSPMLMTMEWRMGGTSTHRPSLRSWRPLTLSSWKRRMMPPASVWARRPLMRSGLGHGG